MSNDPDSLLPCQRVNPVIRILNYIVSGAVAIGVLAWIAISLYNKFFAYTSF